MTPLQTTILLVLHEHGPMCEAKIWGHTSVTGITPVSVACIELQALGHIELPSNVRPFTYDWQLTDKGREYITGLKTHLALLLAGAKEEVPLGSH